MSDERSETDPPNPEAERAVAQLLQSTGLIEEDRSWQAEVLKAVDARERVSDAPERSPSGRRWLTVLVPVAAAIVLVWSLQSRPPHPVEGSTEPEHQTVAGITVHAVDGAVMRSGDPFYGGATIELHATTGGARFAELRVYRDDRAVLARCPGDPECTVTPEELVVRVRLPARGHVQPLLLLSDRPLPAPTGTLDADIAAAVDAEPVLPDPIEIF